MGRCGIDLVREAGMNEGIVRVLSSGRIVCNVEELILKILHVANAMFVESFLPDVAPELIAHREGEAAFDELCRAFDGLRGREKNMKMVRHDDKTVEEIAPLFAITKEDGKAEFGVCSSLENAKTIVSDRGESKGLRLDAHRQI